MKLSMTTLVLLLAVTLSGCKSAPKAALRPALVPSSAVWAGGADGGSFFQCDIDTQDNVNRCLVYNDHTGDVEGGGFFRISSANRAAREDELQYRFFDGDRIYVASGTLVPVGVIKPNGVPDDAVFVNGLFIHCDDAISGLAQCTIYRPDGTEYFKASFTGDIEMKANGYKFFDLSERKIHLLGGGSLLAK